VNHILKAQNILFKKSSFARKSPMWWPGRGNSAGSWRPEEKKANMWHRRGYSGGSWPSAFPPPPSSDPTQIPKQSQFVAPE